MIKIGDQIKLTLSINSDKGKNIIFPVFDKEIIPDIEIISTNGIIKKENGKIIEQSFIITAFNDSTYKIPPFIFIVDKDTLLSNPLVLDVSYIKPDSAFLAKIDTTQLLKIADIKNPMDTPLTFNEFWSRFGIFIIIGISLIIISILIYYLYKRYKQNKPIFSKPEPIIPPHIWAFEKLDVIKKSNLISESKIKEYYTELIQIIKIYIEKRYKIPALEFTSTDLVNYMKSSELIKKEQVDSLNKILFYADFAKFAKAKHTSMENDLNLKESYDFVEKTKEIIAELTEQSNESEIKI
jgi:hypothetical protein